MSELTPASIYTHANAAYHRFEQLAGAHGEVTLPGHMMIPHVPIDDTPLAAALITLGVPVRDPHPFTDQVEVATDIRRRWFWLGAMTDDPRAHSENREVAEQHRTEWLVGAWLNRERFEREHPLHPLIPMRAAFDAREYWLGVINRRTTLPRESSRGFFTDSIRDASILKASGYRPLGWTGRAFILDETHRGMPAEEALRQARQPSATHPGWAMFKALHTLNELLKLFRREPPILVERVEDQTLLLRADATPQTRDKFHALL